MFWICMVSTLATSPLWKQFDLNSLKMEAKIKNNNNTSVSCRGHCMALTTGSKPEPLCTSSLCAADCRQSNTTFYCLTTCTAWWIHLELNTAEICLTFGCLYSRSKKRRSVCVCASAVCQSIVLPPKHWLFKTTGFLTSKSCISLWRAANVFPYPHSDLHPKKPHHTHSHIHTHTHTRCHQKQAISH